MRRFVFMFLLTCTVEDQLATIRPGASYVIHRGDYDGIEWLDRGQAKPTKVEMDQALSGCIASHIDSAKVQAKSDLNNGSRSPVQRIDAIVKYLELDR